MDQDTADSLRDLVLSVKDEFLLIMIKLCLGLTNHDISIRSEVAEANTFVSWLNLPFIQLGTLEI